MKKEVAEKWVAALRSGEYKQGKLALFNGESYCCLGVLCDISGLAEFKDKEFSGAKEYLGQFGYLPPEVANWAGLARTKEGEPRLDVRAPVVRNKSAGTLEVLPLSYVNDALDMTFPEIADLVEKNWETL